ncbi:MAG: hypothetical protein E7665_07165 [Ruminococcaceae bacterium]|nr:hypothetical protein [Oscillospiraceae bacterium]
MKNNAFNIPVTPKSPFAIYPAEKVKVVQNNDICDTQILSYTDELVILTINEMLFATDTLLHELFLQLYPEQADINEISTSLNKLFAAGYLSKIELISPMEISVVEVYKIGTQGELFLETVEKEANLLEYLNGLDAIGIKKILAALQLVISQNYSQRAKSIIVSSIVSNTNSSKKNDKIFRPVARVNFDSETIFIESVRRTENSIADLIAKLKRMNSVLSYPEPFDIDIKLEQKITVILITEDDSHMEELRKILDENNKKYCFNIILTNDVEINTAPKTCLHPHERKISNFEMMLSSIAKVIFEGV